MGSGSAPHADGIDIRGQWAVVAGGSKGIGEGIARALVERGANVMITARGRDDLEKTAESLRAVAGDGQDVLLCPSDLSTPEGVEEMMGRIRDEVPRLNIFVANAGTGVVMPFLETPLAVWNDIVALNMTGVFLSTQAAARSMTEHDDENRCILVVSSIRALAARPGRSVYGASKAGVNQLVRIAALELAEHGIRINALSPGVTDTPLTASNPGILEQAVAGVPLKRATTPGDLGMAAVYLCSSSARFITGANLVVDGGESLH